MFALGTLAFIGISLFMVHEFEEIICVRPYIKRHREDEKFAAEMFVAGGDKNYPSTESIALMIGENSYSLSSSCWSASPSDPSRLC